MQDMGAITSQVHHLEANGIIKITDDRKNHQSNGNLKGIRKQGSWRLEDVKSKPWFSCHTSNDLPMWQCLSVHIKDRHEDKVIKILIASRILTVIYLQTQKLITCGDMGEETKGWVGISVPTAEKI